MKNNNAVKLLASDEWRAQKFYGLSSLPFDELEELENAEFEYYEEHGHWSSHYAYVLVGIIADVFHSVRFDEFKARYPLVVLGKQALPYYCHAEKDEEVKFASLEKPEKAFVVEQLTLF